MIPSLSRKSVGALVLVAATAFAVGSARAQGTDAQREACTPDAFRLCQSTIPDVDKTTACMKAHFAQLSKRCKLAFNDATGGTPEPSAPQHEAVAPPPAAAEPETEATVGVPSITPGLSGYAAQIRGYCRQGLIDPYTCRNTLAALHGMQ